VLACSPISYCDPWKSNETFAAVCVEVDGDDPLNAHTSQQLDRDENIQVLMVSLENTLFDSPDEQQEYDESEDKERRLVAVEQEAANRSAGKKAVPSQVPAKIKVGSAAEAGYASPLAHTIMTLCSSKGFAIEAKVLAFIQGLEFCGMFQRYSAPDESKYVN